MFNHLSEFEVLESPFAAADEPRKQAQTIRGQWAPPIFLTEFAVIALAANLGSIAYYSLILRETPPLGRYLSAALLIAAYISTASLMFRNYQGVLAQPKYRFVWSGLGAATLGFSFFLSTIFFLKLFLDYSRGTFFLQFVSVLAAMICVRAFGYASLKRGASCGRFASRQAVLIGHHLQHSPVARQLFEDGIRVVHAWDFPGLGETGSCNAESIKVPSIHEIVAECRRLCPDDVIVVPAPNNLICMYELANAFSELSVSLHVVLAGVDELLAGARICELGSLTTAQILRPPLSTSDRICKRGFDIIVATLGLLFLAPFLPILAIAIKLESPGPFCFRQMRHGYNNQIIRVFKFRTMSSIDDGDSFKQAVKNDTRVTRVGRILRRTNIDELLQLVNVLLGEMSLVGPRPHPVALNCKFENEIKGLFRRHTVKPGITGWAQVNGHRGRTDTVDKMRQRIDDDLFYISNWSMLLDFKILFMTLFSRSAYTNAD